MEKAIYHETQRMMQPWVTVLTDVVLVALIVVLFCSYYEILPKGNLNIWALIALTALLVAIILLSLFLRMDVTVTEKEVRIRTISTRVIARSDIERMDIRENIHALREYGGWGIRWWCKGIGYIAPGNNGGVELYVKGREHGIMISSRTPKELYKSLQ
jgi:hypothetical protein